MNGLTPAQVRTVWELMAANEWLWEHLLLMEPRLSPQLTSMKERLYAAELFSNFVHALMQKGW